VCVCVCGYIYIYIYIFISVVIQLLSPVRLFETPYQPPLSSTISWNLLKFMSIESVMLSNHLTLCCPLSFCIQSYPAYIYTHIMCTHIHIYLYYIYTYTHSHIYTAYTYTYIYTAYIHTHICIFKHTHIIWSFPGDSEGRESTCNVGDPGSIPAMGRSPG